MSLGLYVTGTRTARPADLLGEVLGWLVASYATTLCATMRGVDDDGQPCLMVSFHPGAEDIVLTLRADAAPGTIGLAASAVTSTAGPGYHAHVCEMLHALGAAFDVAWDPEDPRGETGDETGYFHTKNRRALEDAAARWLQTLAGRVREVAADGNTGIALSMPEGREYTHDGLVTTPMGPRDAGWLDATCLDGRSGFDVFPWAEAGTGAGYLRGRALVRMWADVHWRAPGDDDEREMLEEIVALLEAAYRDDPERTYPWREWAEILALLGRDSILATRAQLRAETAPLTPPIGYRRRDVRVTLSGGWSMVVPGSLAEAWDERGTWSGFDRDRTIWFTSFSLKAERDAGAQKSQVLPATAEETLAGLPPLDGETTTYLSGGIRGIAALGRGSESGVEMQQLRAYAALPANAAVLTVCFGTDAERAWAYDVWRSLRCATER